MSRYLVSWDAAGTAAGIVTIAIELEAIDADLSDLGLVRDDVTVAETWHVPAGSVEVYDRIGLPTALRPNVTRLVPVTAPTPQWADVAREAIFCVGYAAFLASEEIVPPQGREREKRARRLQRSIADLFGLAAHVPVRERS